MAIASLRPGRIGVDLVRVSRVSMRAFTAIATTSEAAILAPLGSLAPAAAWAIKEASIKAFGTGGNLGMTRIRITLRDGRLLAGPVDPGLVDAAQYTLPVRMWISGDWLIAGMAPDRIGSRFPCVTSVEEFRYPSNGLRAHMLRQAPTAGTHKGCGSP